MPVAAVAPSIVVVAGVAPFMAEALEDPTLVAAGTARTDLFVRV